MMPRVVRRWLQQRRVEDKIGAPDNDVERDEATHAILNTSTTKIGRSHRLR